MPQISELIGRRPLVHASMNDTVRNAAQEMTEKKIGAVAILDDGKLVGIFTERDIMQRVVAAGLDPDGTPVGTVMTRELVVASPDEDMDSALHKMQSIRCRHLPIVDEGNLVGMLSLRDLLQVENAATRQRATFLSELVTYSPDYES